MRKKDITGLTYLMIILASYRLTHLVVFDKITEFLRNPFLKKIVQQNDQGEFVTKKTPVNKFGYLLNCYWCAGIWCSFFIGVGYLLFPRFMKKVIFILSIAGAQTILETAVGMGTKSVEYLSKATDQLQK